MAPIKKGTLLLGVAILAGVFAAVKFFMPSQSQKQAESMPATGNTKIAQPSMPSQGAVKPAESVVDKQAKEVSVKAPYQSPAGEESVDVTVFVDSTGIIIDAKSSISSMNEISKKRQAAFAEGLPMAVKGKKLSELTMIDKVGGSSLTTKAFNEALPRLKAGL